MKTFVSWSGGKDAALSCFKAMQDENLEIEYLLNMISEDGNKSRTHGIDSNLMELQASLIGIPVFQRKTTWNNYEAEFKTAVTILKEKNIKAGVFGDIDFQIHRDWVERVCKDLDIQPFFPLWQKKRIDIMREFIDSGFEAYIITTVAEKMDEKWLGRKIDYSFVEDMKNLPEIDLCGEAGEYHTLVVSGPNFKKRINLKETKVIKRDEYYFLDILGYDVHEKI
jgi:diphthine-ammonia ligase